MFTNPLAPVGAPGTRERIEPVPETRPRPAAEEIAAWAITGALLLFVLFEHLVTAAVVALAMYAILQGVSTRISRRMSGHAARPLALLVVAVLTAAIVAGAVTLIVALLRRGASNIPDMMNQMAEILGSFRLWLGGIGHQFIPEFMTESENLKTTIADWLKAHALTLRAGGLYVGRGLVHAIMGVLLAILIFFRHVTHQAERRGPLSYYLSEKATKFGDAFSRVATAQIKISALNTTLTALYLLVALPLFGVHVPFASTLVVVTFVCGLIPVLGNLVSNTVITILSMGVSVGVAFASLAFLVVIHKLEYLMNAKIVGGETDAEAWEVLAAILIGEAAFGVGGVVLAPIIYAFVKRELRDRALI